MSNINILIVDDDLAKISAIVTTIKKNTDQILLVRQASNVQEATDWLIKENFHLMITDILMPLKEGMIPDPNGGRALIKNLYRNKKKIQPPLYIVGLTQYDDLKERFNSVWKVWHFDLANEEWRYKLRDLIFHISLIKPRITIEKKETIFVEGYTDKRILDEAIKIFSYPLLSDIEINTREYGAGASWVERQLIIWAKSLSRKVNCDSYIKAVGLFDDDDAGRKSIERLNNIIKQNTAEASTISILRYAHKYSPLLKSIKRKGISYSIELEDLLGDEVWEEAKNKRWLIRRSEQDYLFDQSICSLKIEDMKEEHLRNNGFSEVEMRSILFKVNDVCKLKLLNYVLNLDPLTKKKCLQNISYLLKEIHSRLRFEHCQDI